MDGEDQQNLADRALCVDPEYNVLWTYSPSSLEVNCFNPVASEVKGKENNTKFYLFLPSLSLSLSLFLCLQIHLVQFLAHHCVYLSLKRRPLLVLMLQ